MKETVLSALLGAAAIVCIAGGMVYLNKNVSCWDFFGLYKGCGVTTVK